jgi:putative glycerol-1-phosphate prenyltransferase
MHIYKKIVDLIKDKKLFAMLIDPEKHSEKTLLNTVQTAEITDIDIFFVGGSLVSDKIERTITLIKSYTRKPVILFPGSLMQISSNADALLLLSLISGRNPEYLIGNHVIAAPYLKKSHLEVISTAYILVDGGSTSSVEYISNTKPIPAHKADLAAATAIAGEMIGHKLVYLEAGSGATKPVPSQLIKAVKQNISVPLIVGGGIRTKERIQEVYEAGADIVVVGNAFEDDLNLSLELSSASRSMK